MGACCSVNKGPTEDTLDGYTSMVQKVEQLQAEVTDRLTEQPATAEASVKIALEDIAQRRMYINAYFDKIESTLVAQCDKITLDNGLEATKNSDKLTSSCKLLDTVHAQLTSNIDYSTDLFARANEVRPTVVAIENEIKTINETELLCVEFVKNWELQVSTLTVFLDKQRKRLMNMAVQYKADIRVVDSSDRNQLGMAPCYISGMIHVRENIIACTDWNKLSVKLVDIKHCKIVSTVLLNGSPWDITSISRDAFAVTITPFSQIQYIEVKNDIMSLTNVIGVNGKCRGIDCIDDKLAVSYDNPPKVEIMDLNGNVLKVIQTDSDGTDLFKCPYYVVFSRCGRSIYVSNVFGRSITKFTVDGTVQASYKGSDMNETWGMCVCRDGSLFVCSPYSVYVMSGDCKLQKALITRKQGVNLPKAICFDEDSGILSITHTIRVEHVIQTFAMK